ncbi:hypothetical protein [Halomonas litopenaei]|uniref:hypothetical protein n=1 Tax=Halomonas litopenaei TaxID=2109328 RepID=UPI003FA16C1B
MSTDLANKARLVARQGGNQGIEVAGGAAAFQRLERGPAGLAALVSMPLQAQQAAQREQVGNRHRLIGRLLAKKLGQSVCIHCHDTAFVFHSIKEA